MKRLEKLLQQRAKLVNDIREIGEKAEKEGRNLLGEERTQIDAIEADIAALEGDIERTKRQIEREKSLTQPVNQEAQAVRSGGFQTTSQNPQSQRATQEYRDSFARYLSTGEARDLIAGTDPQGGYLIPEAMSSELLQDLKKQVVMRQISRVRPPLRGVKSIGNPTISARMSSFKRGTELGRPTYDTSLKFGKRSMTVIPFVGSIKVSRSLLFNATLADVEAIIREEIARDRGEFEEQEFLTGDGAGHALGVFTASNDGIPTTRDVNTGLATGLTADGLVRIVETLDSRYFPNAKWLVHNDFVLNARLLKDGNGQYIWKPGLDAGKPDTLLNFPIVRGSYVPHTFANGLYVAVFGDFQHYWIQDSADMSIQKLVELYAEDNMDAYIVRGENDAAPVRAEAFVRAKCAA